MHDNNAIHGKHTKMMTMDIIMDLECSNVQLVKLILRIIVSFLS